MDESVIRDIQRLVTRSSKLDNSIIRFIAIIVFVLGLPLALLGRDYPELVYSAVACFAMGFCFLVGTWIEGKGRSRFGLDQVISGRVYGAGIVIDQLGGRTDWNLFCRARLSSSAVLLYVHVKQAYGFPLHRSFFKSEEAWQEVSQLIREQVRGVSLVADE